MHSPPPLLDKEGKLRRFSTDTALTLTFPAFIRTRPFPGCSTVNELFTEMGMLSLDTDHIQQITEELSLNASQVAAAAELLEQGATIPFISRYRKEATGSLDEVAITAIRDRSSQLRELDKRRESILKSLREREMLTEELENRILAAETMTTLEIIVYIKTSLC